MKGEQGGRENPTIKQRVRLARPDRALSVQALPAKYLFLIRRKKYFAKCADGRRFFCCGTQANTRLVDGAACLLSAAEMGYNQEWRKRCVVHGIAHATHRELGIFCSLRNNSANQTTSPTAITALADDDRWHGLGWRRQWLYELEGSEVSETSSQITRVGRRWSAENGDTYVRH